MILPKSVGDNLYSPKSAFINALPAGKYSVTQAPEIHYYGSKKGAKGPKGTKKNHEGVFHKFFFIGEDGIRITFTSFDISNFLHQMEGELTSDVNDWKIDVTKPIGMLREFTLLNQKPVFLRDVNPPTKKYPLFAFDGYADYKIELAKKKANKSKLKETLFSTKIPVDKDELYYRQNILAEQIIFNTEEPA